MFYKRPRAEGPRQEGTCLQYAMARRTDDTARTRWSAAAICLAVAALTGCAPLATVTCCKPAAIDVEGVRQLAVMDFRGENGTAVSAAVTARLWDSRFYTLVDPAELAPVQHASLSPPAREEFVLRQAREAGVDAVILGEVLDYRCDDEPLTRTDSFFGRDSGRKFFERERLQVSLIPRDRVRREATVNIAFRLVDARTGEVRATRQCAHHFKEDLDVKDGELPPRGKVLNDLTEDCVAEFVELLAPHEASCQMRLARSEWPLPGAIDVRRGNRAALSGNWQSAREHWRKALEKNPNCDSALYNLAIDSASRQMYAEAEELAMQALQVEHCELYTLGLADIRRQRSEFESSLEQHDDRVLQAVATFRPSTDW